MVAAPARKGGKAKKIMLAQNYGPGSANLTGAFMKKSYAKVQRRVQKHKVSVDREPVDIRDPMPDTAHLVADFESGQIFDNEPP